MISKDEMIRTEQPTAKACKNCLYALKSIKVGKTTIERYGHIKCDQYASKPHEVLWDGADCPLFQKG